MASPTEPHAPLRLPFWAALLLLAAASFALSRVGLALPSTPSLVPAFWPASGLLLGAFLLSGPRRWPWILLAGLTPTVAFDILGGHHSARIVIAFAAGNAVE